MANKTTVDQTGPRPTRMALSESEKWERTLAHSHILHVRPYDIDKSLNVKQNAYWMSYYECMNRKIILQAARSNYGNIFEQMRQNKHTLTHTHTRFCQHICRSKRGEISNGNDIESVEWTGEKSNFERDNEQDGNKLAESLSNQITRFDWNNQRLTEDAYDRIRLSR